MDQVCLHCLALKFQNEPPGMCCSNGKISLWPLQEPPEPLRSYLSGTTTDSRHFLQNIRKYNSSFQMTSFGASHIVNYGGFMPTFKVKGQIYHRIGSFLPENESDSIYLQIYFMGDKETETDRRCELNQGTRREIIAELQDFFHQNNSLVQTFTTALEQIPSNEYQVVIRADKTPIGEHERRFNAPIEGDVAIVMIGTEFEKRSIIIKKRNSDVIHISETHRMYDGLQYPIIFWNGQDGYHFKIMQCNPVTGEPSNKKVSCLLFVIEFNLTLYFTSMYNYIFVYRFLPWIIIRIVL